MTWLLNGIELPIPPAKFKKRTIRQAKIVSTLEDFPNPDVNQPTRFELQIEGLIWPRGKARSLDEATKNAESNEFVVFTDDAVNNDPWISGIYAVLRSEIKVDKVMFTTDPVGGSVEVFSYNIVFAKYADLDSVEPADEGDGEDEGTNFLDMPDDIGFDENGDGDLDADEFFNWMRNIFTFGVIK